MKNTKWSLLAMLFALVLVLAACGTKEDDAKSSETSGGSEIAEDGFATKVTNDGDAIEGGTLMVAMQKDEPFQGIFAYSLYDDGYDSDLMSFANTNVFSTDGDFLLTNDGIASYEVDEATNVVTVKIREDVKWSDGEPLTIDDLIYPYYIIADKDYPGVRYDSDMRNIKGIEEYHNGTADTISGITRVDDYTYTLALNTISPGLYSGGDGILTYAEPVHAMKDIPVGELIESDVVRKNPLSLSAFVVDKIIAGESVQYKRNENYYKGAAKLDGVIVKVVPSSSIAKAIETGEFDVTLTLGSAKYNEIKDLKNIDIVAVPELYYSYLGFKVGKWNEESLEVATDMENSKMGDVKLRQAMGYALDIETVTETFYDGLRERANAIVPPVFSSFHDANLEGYTYNTDKANALLDEAGYKDVDGDGIREDAKGEKFSIKMAGMSGSDTDEAIVEYYRQNWKDVGLDVQLTTGRLIEFNSFYDKVKADDAEIDMFMAAWGTGTNPSPLGLYGESSAFNYSRYVTPELESLLVAIDSKEAIDPAVRADAFRAWEEYMFEQATTIPTYFRTEIMPINKRVKNYDSSYANLTQWHEVELTAEEPIK